MSDPDRSGADFRALRCRSYRGPFGPALIFEDENGDTTLILYTPEKIGKQEPPIVFDLADEIAERWGTGVIKNFAEAAISQCDCRGIGDGEYEPCAGCEVFIEVTGTHPKVFMEALASEKPQEGSAE